MTYCKDYDNFFLGGGGGGGGGWKGLSLQRRHDKVLYSLLSLIASKTRSYQKPFNFKTLTGRVCKIPEAEFQSQLRAMCQFVRGMSILHHNYL